MTRSDREAEQLRQGTCRANESTRADKSGGSSPAPLVSYYRKAAIHWLVSAKRNETRERRLATLIAQSAAGRPVPQLTPRRQHFSTCRRHSTAALVVESYGPDVTSAIRRSRNLRS
jgi:hypothetical protein